MALTPEQTKRIDEMIEANAKRADIVYALAQMQAGTRDVEDYLKENKTLQGMLNTMTRRAKEILPARTEDERRELVAEIVTLGTKAVKLLQRKAGQ